MRAAYETGVHYPGCQHLSQGLLMQLTLLLLSWNTVTFHVYAFFSRQNFILISKSWHVLSLNMHWRLQRRCRLLHCFTSFTPSAYEEKLLHFFFNQIVQFRNLIETNKRFNKPMSFCFPSIMPFIGSKNFYYTLLILKSRHLENLVQTFRLDGIECV